MDIDPKVIERMRRWCALRERSQEEVKRKLITLEIRGRLKDSVLALLIEEGFVNEARYAEAYVSGKFKMKGWGKRKIMMGLRLSGTDERLANKALGHISESDYRKALQKHLEKYAERLKASDVRERKAKTARYLLGKGYEPEAVWEEINRYFI